MWPILRGTAVAAGHQSWVQRGVEDVNWGGAFVLIGLLGVAVTTMPWGLLVLAGLAVVLWRS